MPKTGHYNGGHRFKILYYIFNMKCLLIFTFLLSFVYSINPSQNGVFPIAVLENFAKQEIGSVYGNDGWIKKIQRSRVENNRNSQLEFNLPVLLAKYSDVNDTYFSANDFQNLLFDNNPAGTLKDYYDEISYGNFTVDGVSKGWYQSSLTMVNAVENTKMFVSEIVSLADVDFNYVDYDNDGPDNIPNSGDDDGYVDGIMIVYSGCGAEWGEGNNNLWPHMSNLGPYEYVTNDIGANGSNIIISSYAVSPELAGGGNCFNDIIRPIGVFAHEFGHILGLPDLYDRNGNDGNSEGLGDWCLMASGSWSGWAGDTPAHMSIWCKAQLGWVTPTTLFQNEIDYIIPQINSNPFGVKIWEDDYNSSRYFLIENRQPVGFDSDINGAGLLIYHIDENQRYGINRWSAGLVNDNAEHKLVDLEEADGLDNLDLYYNSGDSGDPYPGSNNNLIFDDYSYPNSNRYNGEETGISVHNIVSSNSNMIADFIVRKQLGYSIFYDEMGISGWGFGSQEPQDSYGGVLFTSEEAGFITEIDVGVRSAPVSLQLLVYDSFSENVPGNLILSKDVYIESSGWHSESIDSLEIHSNSNFFVCVKINGSYAISYDNNGVLSGRSYFSSDGINYNNNISNYGDINIRSKISYEIELETADVHDLPSNFGLKSAYPNPFNPFTSLRYDLPNDGLVNLTVYDMTGRVVKTLVNGSQTAGFKSVLWNATNDRNEPVSAGLYLYTIQAGEFRQTKKMVLLK